MAQHRREDIQFNSVFLIRVHGAQKTWGDMLTRDTTSREASPPKGTQKQSRAAETEGRCRSLPQAVLPAKVMSLAWEQQWA